MTLEEALTALETEKRLRGNAESDALNQRAIAQGAEADYRRAKAERDTAYGILRRMRALTVGRPDISSKVLRGMIDTLGDKL